MGGMAVGQHYLILLEDLMIRVRVVQVGALQLEQLARMVVGSEERRIDSM